ncbi:hypothetical protein [Streptomyces sp. TRM49041]|uniref:hypothetical protein n=1 Tax=Streptomyces sp. TRM49041 TaxID=2603216 RepID=UPI0021CCA590|nr:hypothetical protein [Streptomyces sp. TRM49041]
MTTATSTAADGEIPPPAVEDFTYPGATTILAERGIKLLRGDGHVVLTECKDATGEIKVWTRKGDVCFQATASAGFVTMEIAEVWGLSTTSHPISADLTANGKTTTMELPKGAYESVGEGTGAAPTTLLELRVTG